MTYEDPEYGTLPVTADEWRIYLAEYGPWTGQEPATEARIVEAEQRLGIALPPSLRGFLLVSNGWGKVSMWTAGLCSVEEIEWFRDADEAFIDGYLSGAEDFGEEIDEATDIFLNALSVAYGEDTILLDTVHRSPNGEYEAYLLAVKYGALHETCASFSAAIAKGRAEIESGR